MHNCCHRIARICGFAIASLAVVTSLGGCSSRSVPPVTMNGTQDTMSSKHAYLVRGQMFTVRLPTTCGSNYGWRLSPESADCHLLTLVERRSQQVEPGEPDVLRDPSWDMFTFRANHTGAATIEFIYDEPYCPEREPMRQFTLNFDVCQTGADAMQTQQASVAFDQP